MGHDKVYVTVSQFVVEGKSQQAVGKPVGMSQMSSVMVPAIERAFMKGLIMEYRQDAMRFQVFDEPGSLCRILENKIKHVGVVRCIRGNAGPLQNALRLECAQPLIIAVPDHYSSGLNVIDVLKLGIQECGNNI